MRATFNICDLLGFCLAIQFVAVEGGKVHVCDTATTAILGRAADLAEGGKSACGDRQAVCFTVCAGAGLSLASPELICLFAM